MYEEALASQDWAQVSPLLHRDVTVTFSNGTFRGISEVQTAFERNFSEIQDELYEISNLSWVYRADDSAACTYNFNWKGYINGQESSGSGRGSSVLFKDGATWKIIMEHLGPNAI